METQIHFCFHGESALLPSLICTAWRVYHWMENLMRNLFHPAHLDSATLLYPGTLLCLLKVWLSLEDHGKVSFQKWCDHFYNHPRGPLHSDAGECSRIYTAAFLALWICFFAIVGGGPYIRPSVLVMASWMTLGRRFALAQPALCSLYYSLRLIQYRTC